MAAINRVASPMNICQENLELSREKLDRKIQKLRGRQNVRSPFLIGSIEEVSTKISKLDRKLQSYTELVVESRASEHHPEYKPPSSAKGREKYQIKERDGKELTKFAGIYAVKSTFGVGTSERVKNISKISMNPSKTNVKRDSNKPKFVELHQYPGYDATEITPLPDEVPAVQILRKVSDAQVHLLKKPSYRVDFDKLMLSQMSQAILVDIFWWYFLERFQADKEAQSKLFNRVSHNYVKLLLYCKDPNLREVFLKDYANILAQGVYASFCESFPDSYRQFDADFKEDLISLVTQWVVGLKPAPRTWMKWNLDMLEPANIKVREEMSKNNKAGKKMSSMNFDYLGVPTGQGSIHSSQTTLNQSGSVKSNGEGPFGKKNGQGPRKANSSSNGSSQDLIGKVADAQVPPKSILKKSGSEKDVKKVQHALVMSPIVETRFQEPTPTPTATPSTALSRIAGGKKISPYWNSAFDPKRESHPACRGPEFIKYVFNIQGQSPLVAHFLKKKNLKSTAGVDVKVQRTEIKSLPSLEERTYMDIISESFKKVKNRSKECQELFERGRKGRGEFIKKLQEEQKLILDRQAALLSNPREIKRLSNLIILEHRKDQDSITAGASAAMDAALRATTTE
ncbi:protein FAM227B-like [Lineus longissimus]|uniref:protein FAM227B-like n=1 Tax=Lineus longissimus TaxID=88925 RepID=UPI00315C4D18